MADWHLQYLGRQFDSAAWNCWTLVRAVHRDVLGVELPEGAPAEPAARGGWQTIGRGAERPLDVASFSLGGCEAHVGMVVAPGFMLHVTSGQTTQVERYGAGPWARRLVAFHRRRATVP